MKKLTFEQIAPLWASVIAKKGIKDAIKLHIHKVKGRNLNILTGARCIVGEAHGFRRDYQDSDKKGYCPACDGFCYALLDNKKFLRTKVQFVKHWNAEHAK